jgi:hypothetical protein
MFIEQQKKEVRKLLQGREIEVCKPQVRFVTEGAESACGIARP